MVRCCALSYEGASDGGRHTSEGDSNTKHHVVIDKVNLHLCAVGDFKLDAAIPSSLPARCHRAGMGVTGNGMHW